MAIPISVSATRRYQRANAIGQTVFDIRLLEITLAPRVIEIDKQRGELIAAAITMLIREYTRT